MTGRTTTLCLVLWATVLPFAPIVKSSGHAPSPAKMAEFWVDPGTTRRNLFDGPGVPELNPAERPIADARYEVVSRDTGGFSITYHVRDQRDREWSAKIGPEAQPEVVTSRILWALGYHQAPSFFVERWVAVDQAKGSMLGGARFRPRKMGLKSLGDWSWQESSLAGTAPYNGLLVLLMILNSTDLKNENNTLYEVVGGPREHASRWFVVKDLGASLGETGRMDPRRGYIEGFEREPFITGVEGGRVRFGFRGRHQELLDRIGVEDVHWTCERLKKLTDRQWQDAFRAGNVSQALTARYVARIRQKIKEGLEIQEGLERR